MKTLVIFSGYYLPHIGGMERYTNNMAREFSKYYKTIIVTSKYDENLKDEEISCGFTIYRLEVFKLFKSRFPIPKFNKRNKEILKKVFNNNVISIICHTRFFLTSLIGAKYGKKKNIPVYVVDHGSDHLTMNNSFLDFFIKNYEHIITKIIKKYHCHYYGVSKASLEWLKHFKITGEGVWYNSIDTSIKLYKRKEHNNFIFLYAGRLVEQKGLRNIIDAFNILSKEYNNVELNIAGNGNMLEELQKLSKDNKKIKILGKKSFDELLRLYSKADVFLYPTIWPEGLPTALLEAGLNKCTVITTAEGGNKEIITDKQNGLIADKTAEDLYIKMKEVYNKKNLRNKLANQLFEDVNNYFSWERNAIKILSDMNLDKELENEKN